MNELLKAIYSYNIREDAGSSFYQRGVKYHKNGHVSLIELDDESAHLQVKGSQIYDLHIELEGSELDYECDCPAFDDYMVCKHVVAGFLYLKEYGARLLGLKSEKKADGRVVKKIVLGGQPPQKIDTRWRKKMEEGLQTAVYQKQRSTRYAGNQKYLLFFSLQHDRWSGMQLVGYKLSPTKLPSELYDKKGRTLLRPLEDVLAFIEANRLTARDFTEVKEQTKLHAEACLNLPQLLVSMLLMVSRSYDFYYYSFIPYLSEIVAGGGIVYLGDEEIPLQYRLQTAQGTVQASLELSINKQHMALATILHTQEERFPLDEDATSFGNGPVWLILDDQLMQFDSSVDLSAWALLVEINQLQIPLAEIDFFAEHFLEPIMSLVDIEGDVVEWSDVVDEAPRKQLFLTEDERNKGLIATLMFKYGDHTVPFSDELESVSIVRRKDELEAGEKGTQQAAIKIGFQRIRRDPTWEEEVWRSISNTRFGLKRRGSGHDAAQFVLRSATDPVDFLLKKIPNLAADRFEIFGEENLKSIKVNRHRPTLSINVSSGIDWFDLNTLIQFGDIEVKLPQIRKALRNKERYLKLADGSIGEIPEEWVEKYRHLFNLGTQNEESIRFENHHLTLIDQLLETVDEVEIDRAYQERLAKLKNFDGITQKALPPTFQGELRPYQKAGYDWLHFLREFHFGGCLADDMGLGKTVQMLAYLASVRDGKNQLPADLIVLPRSLLVNWEREAARFTPRLRTFIHFGPQREKETDHFDQHDLILTTYGTMRRDIEVLRHYRFSTIVLDEAQAIKNPGAQVSKAVRLLQAGQRLTMSGTPVENSTFELWSQFAFLNPGLLGSADYFRKSFGNPIERNQDEETASFLKGMVFPFILRRTKEQVAPDLPPRTDEILYVDMEPAQRKFYEKTRDQYRAELLGLVEEKGIDGARMKVLEGLLRMRQICNHPKLVNPKFKGESAKLELLLERLDGLSRPDEDGRPHKALVFSQFVQMLKLIEPELKKRKLRYSYLDGQTRKRQEQIDAFQNDPDIPFFLISLKAGGVGLNLTAADYVIHVDPWWNPAVEMQATDRTHRIGQDKPVFVYKMITRDSVEEKILELQRRKQKLVDQLIAAESSFFKELTTDDIDHLFGG